MVSLSETRLPPEIRLEVYKHILTFPNALQPIKPSTTSTPRKHVIANTSLLATSRLILNGALEIFHKRNALKLEWKAFNVYCSQDNQRNKAPMFESAVIEFEECSEYQTVEVRGFLAILLSGTRLVAGWPKLKQLKLRHLKDPRGFQYILRALKIQGRLVEFSDIGIFSFEYLVPKTPGTVKPPYVASGLTIEVEYVECREIWSVLARESPHSDVFSDAYRVRFERVMGFFWFASSLEIKSRAMHFYMM